jgi:hypothetical protein
MMLINKVGGSGVAPVRAQAKACGYKSAHLNAPSYAN